MLLALLLFPVVHCAQQLSSVDWFSDARKTLEARESSKIIEGRAKNVILFIGDGMGVSTHTAARTYKAQRGNINLHESSLAWEDFPYSSMSKTYILDLLTPDSSATATAFLTGVKVNALTMAVDYRVKFDQCDTMSEDSKLKSILKMAHEQGKWTGIVTTTRVTHATPAAAYAHSPSRMWEADYKIPEGQKHCEDIAKQLINDNDYIRVVLGGGRSMFLGRDHKDPALNITGKRTDGLNLLKMWKDKQEKKPELRKNGAKMIYSREELLALDGRDIDYLLGLFTPSNMSYEIDRPLNEPTLSEMTEKAIEILSQNEKGFFLLVEGGRIDHAHHDNQAQKAIVDTLMLSEAVQKAADMTDELDTLSIVTADHSHSLTISGYSTPDNDILGFSTSPTSQHFGLNVAEDGLPYLTLSYQTGPGFYEHRTNGSINTLLTRRKNITQDVINQKNKNKEFKQDAAIPMELANHAGEDVTVHAQGPMAHLFSGTHEQNYIAHVIMYSACMQPYSRKCQRRDAVTTGKLNGRNGGDSASSMPVVLPILISFLFFCIWTISNASRLIYIP